MCKWSNRSHTFFQTVFHFFILRGCWIRNCLELMCPSLLNASGQIVVAIRAFLELLQMENTRFCNIKFQFPTGYCLYIWWSLKVHRLLSDYSFTWEKRSVILPPAFHKGCLLVVSELSLFFTYCSSTPVNPISPQIFVHAQLSFSSETVSVEHFWYHTSQVLCEISFRVMVSYTCLERHLCFQIPPCTLLKFVKKNYESFCYYKGTREETHISPV